MLGILKSNRGEESAPNHASNPLKQAELRQIYERPESFTQFLPWVDCNKDTKTFILDDGIGLGAILEIRPIGTESMDQTGLEVVRDAVQVALADSLPEDEQNPWVLQFYLKDDQDLTDFMRKVADYGSDVAKQSVYGQHFRSTFEEHVARLSRSAGLFNDQEVSGGIWRGQIRRTYAVITHRRSDKRTKRQRKSDEEAFNSVVAQFVTALQVAGVEVTRAGIDTFYYWLIPWFNPNPQGIENARELAQISVEGYEAEHPYGFDLAEQLIQAQPRSDGTSGCWFFDDLPHELLTIQSLRRAPEVGHLTAERRQGDSFFALFDRMPEHTIMAMTIIIQAQQTLTDRIARVKRAAVGDSADALLTKEDAINCEREIARGNKLFPTIVSFYLRGDGLLDLQRKLNECYALLLPNGLQPIAREADLLKLDSYIRNLPMVYDPSLDTTTRRSRLMFSSHVANLLPVYGRSRGTGHTGFAFFNRGAEPLVFDPLHPDDRKKNGHMLILGPTGAGKSAMLVYLLQQMVARHRPRIFLIEAGGSFKLLGEHFTNYNLSVNQITLAANEDVSLPPFVDAISLIENDVEVGVSETSASRDRLGEMEIVARVMVTGGDIKEADRMTRADLMLIRTAILNAAQRAKQSGKSEVLTEDVVGELKNLSRSKELPESRRIRAMDMGDSMSLFCSGVAGHFFNRTGQPWPEVDVTILEMGLLAREGYGDQLTVAYLSMMSHINDLVERSQHDERPTLVVTDEGHIITTHPLLANYVVKITKMWRKYGAWFWIATQNLTDFPYESQRMLNMIEWWMCLVLPKEEIEQVARFRELSPTQRQLLQSARKEPGKYVEGVVLSDKLETLFRSVPPPLTLALAMSEKHEKADRQKIMQEHGCSEYEAACRVAAELASRSTV